MPATRMRVSFRSASTLKDPAGTLIVITEVDVCMAIYSLGRKRAILASKFPGCDRDPQRSIRMVSYEVSMTIFKFSIRVITTKSTFRLWNSTFDPPLALSVTFFESLHFADQRTMKSRRIRWLASELVPHMVRPRKRFVLPCSRRGTRIRMCRTGSSA